MKSARHQFILLGFLCQGMAWDSLVHWLLSGALWAIALGPCQRRVKLSSMGELAALTAGCLTAVALGKALGRSAHFFFGDGLILLQAARFLRPLSRREKMVSILVASFHFAVACTLAPDIRFLFLAAAGIILLPKALFEMQREDFDEAAAVPSLSLGWRPFASILAVAVVLFLVVPRFSVGTPLQLGAGPAGQGSLLSSVLDPSEGGLAQSAQILMQIEGEDLRYLKAMALSQFDGERWVVDQNMGFRRLHMAGEAELARFSHRRVRVKNVHFLGRVLPTDGRPVSVRGKFFNRPFLNAHGVIECENTWNTANNQYEYWIDPGPGLEPLSPPLIRFHTQHPKPSPRLVEWLDGITAGATNKLDTVRLIEAHLRSNFTYRLGAPALKRLDALEDFVFGRREGHCERFASALALLARMKGVPTRVAIGYVPGPRSRFSDWRQIRFKDAHAWTEAWFEGVGWVNFDATPGRAAGVDDGYGIRQLLETLDLIWYSTVISFDGPSQRQLATSIGSGLSALPRLVRERGAWFALVLLLGFAPWLWRRVSGWRLIDPRGSTRSTRPAAVHFYSRMLTTLAKAGFQRDPHQTPREFLALLHARNAPALPEIARLTESFCAAHYGDEPIAPAREQSLSADLSTLAAELARRAAAE